MCICHIHKLLTFINCKIEYEKYSPKRIAYYGYIRNSGFTPPDPLLIWDEKGWTWISQVKDNLTSWVRLDLVAHRKIDPCWVPRVLRDGQPISERKAVDVTWRRAKTFAKYNCFLAGDAAFILDPGSSHGVLKAIMSGMMIAYLINESNNSTKLHIMNYYNEWVTEQFNNDLKRLKELYLEYLEDSI